MSRKDVAYEEISKAKVQEKRNVVISKFNKGGYTIAQQLEVEEGNRKTNIFLKGTIHLDDITAIYNLRDALNVVIAKEQDEEADEEEWE